MGKLITINQETCKKCLLCTEVCPNKILVKNEAGDVIPNPERTDICIKCGQCMAVCETEAIVVEGLSYKKDFFELPKYEQETIKTSFYDLISSRRSVRNFKDKTVPKEVLEKVVEAISFAPPSFTPLKTKIIVVQNKDLIKQSVPYMIDFYQGLLKMMKNPIARFFVKKNVGKKRFKTIEEHLVPILTKKISANIAEKEDSFTRNAPAMILFLNDIDGEDINPDISTAASYGMLTVHALGLGGTIIDLIPPAINKDKNLRKMYHIPENQEVVTSLILGYPKYKYKRGIKRNLKAVDWL